VVDIQTRVLNALTVCAGFFYNYGLKVCDL